jgi:hypothetical protein
MRLAARTRVPGGAPLTVCHTNPDRLVLKNAQEFSSFLEIIALASIALEYMRKFMASSLRGFGTADLQEAQALLEELT